MSDTPGQPAPGWYYAQGDPANTQRYWDGSSWQGGPQPIATPGATNPNPIGYGGGATATANLAEPLARLGARLIDGFIWLFVFIVLAVAFGGGAASMGNNDLGSGAWFAGVLGTLVTSAYEVLMVANKGGTVGKLALGLKVVKEDGSPADLQTAIMRIVTNLIGIVPFIGSFISAIVGLASIVMIFTDARKQTVWDKVAKTIVVKR